MKGRPVFVRDVTQASFSASAQIRRAVADTWIGWTERHPVAAICAAWVWRHPRGTAATALAGWLWVSTGSLALSGVLTVALWGAVWLGVLAWRRGSGGITMAESRRGARRMRNVRARWADACEEAGVHGRRGRGAPPLRRVRLIPGGVVAEADAGMVGRSAGLLYGKADILSQVIGCREVVIRPSRTHTVNVAGRQVVRRLTSPRIVEVEFRYSDPLYRTMRLPQLPLPAHPNHVAFGVTADGKPASLALSKSLLIVGTTGSGKSRIIHAGLASLVQQRIPVELRIIDPGGGVDFSNLGRQKGQGTGLLQVVDYSDDSETPQEAKTSSPKLVIHRTWAAMYERLRKMKAAGIDQHVAGPGEPVILLLVDEFLTLDEKLTGGVRGEFGRILTLGRKANVLVWAVSQHGTVEAIGQVRNSFAQRICLRTMTSEMTVAALGDAGRGVDCAAIPESQEGVGYMIVDGQGRPTRFRSVLVSKSEELALAKGQRPAGLDRPGSSSRRRGRRKARPAVWRSRTPQAPVVFRGRKAKERVE